MARRRFQNPTPFRENGHWKIRYRKDVIDENGNVSRVQAKEDLGLIGEGREEVNETQAKRKAAQFMRKIDRSLVKPTAQITFGSYFDGKYQTHFLATSKNHQSSAASLMTNHIMPAFRGLPLKDLTRSSIQALINNKLQAGLSPQTVRHIRKNIAMVLSHAKAEGIIDGDNPASKLKMPPKSERVNPTPALTPDKAFFVVQQAEMPYALMAALSICCSCNVAEMLGLRWKRVNLTDKLRSVDSDFLPPATFRIAEDFTQDEYRPVKTEFRKRTLPIPDALLSAFEAWRSESKFTGPDDPVFAGRTGRPLDYNNANKRIFKRLSFAIESPFTWNSFRHSFSAFAIALKVPHVIKETIMGHSINDPYGHVDFDALRVCVNQVAEHVRIAEALNRESEIPTQKVVSIR